VHLPLQLPQPSFSQVEKYLCTQKMLIATEATATAAAEATSSAKSKPSMWPGH